MIWFPSRALYLKNLKKLLYLVFIFSLATKGLEAQEVQYSLYAHSNRNVPINSLQIFGERNSGTKYLAELLIKNFPKLQAFQTFGHKHFPAWYAFPFEGQPVSQKEYSLEGSDSFLFVIIFRHPFDWLASMNSHPYHAGYGFQNQPIERFATLPWQIHDQDYDFIQRLDRNPANGQLFNNILKLRTARIENMLLIKDKVRNVYYINYETVRDHPEAVVQEIASIFDLALEAAFIPITHTVTFDPNEKSEFHSKPPYKPNFLLKQYILSQLDLDLERSIGYDLKADAS